MANRVATVNFTDLVHNDTFLTRRFNFFQSDGVTAMDLSDTTPKIQIRMNDWNGKLVETCVIGDGLTWNSQANGQLDWGGFVLDYPKAGTYYYDLQITYDNTSIVRTYVRGTMEIIDDSTV